jgi:hypothetical protein
MASSIAELRAQQSKANALLQEKASATERRKAKTDERFWYPAAGKDGTGVSLIRLLPAPPNEESAFVQVFHFNFQGPTGKWYNTNSWLTVGDKTDPMYKFNNVLWNTNNPTIQDWVRGQKAKEGFVCNILVKKDPLNPANEGKVFLFRFGPQLMEIIRKGMSPQKDLLTGIERPAIPIFDLWEGADLRYQFVTGENKQRNYTTSFFEAPGSVFGNAQGVTDEHYDRIWKMEYPLTPFVELEPKEVLVKKIEEVFGVVPGSVEQGIYQPIAGAPPAPSAPAPIYDATPAVTTQVSPLAPVAAFAAPVAPVAAPAPLPVAVSNSDDDLMKKFQNIAAEMD